MRICFLVHELGRSGGAQTIAGYARALAAREGWEADVIVTDPHAAHVAPDLDGVPVRRADEEGLGPYDVAISTWWTTAAWLWEVPATRRIAFLQSIESRFYENVHFYERLAAEQVLALPVDYVTVAGWIGRVMAELRPDARCEVVRNGIDKRVFSPRPRERAGGPLRVLVEGQPSLWFKGVHDAVAAVRAMEEPAELTVLATDPGESGGLEGVTIEGGLHPAAVADVYADHDVVLKLSRVEGLPLCPLEAFHLGLPAIVTPFTGHDEYLVHGHNGLVVGFDDGPGAVRALDRVARDRGLLARLSEGALQTAATWPSAGQAAEAFATAVERLAAGPEPDRVAALAHWQRASRRWTELTRFEVNRLQGMVRWYEGALVERDDALRERGAEVEEYRRRLEELVSSRAYRASVAARRLIPRRPR